MARQAHSDTDTRTADALETVLGMCMVLFSYNPTGQVGVSLVMLAVAQVLAGKPRLQLAPLYLGACMPLALAFGNAVDVYQGALQITSGVLLLSSVALRSLLPIPTLPAPRGKCRVSRVVVFVKQSQLPSSGTRTTGLSRHPSGAPLPRASSFSASSGDREFMLHVYYPTRSAHARPAPYMTHGSDSLAGFATVSGMSALVLQHLRYVRHHVFKGGDVSQRCASYPVLLFSHGLGGSPDCYRALIQEHVSQGFVVVAPEHNDGSAAFTRRQAGHATKYRPLTEAERQDDELSHRLRHAQLTQRTTELAVALEYVRVATSVAKTHTGYRKLRPLRGRVNLAHVAVMGHSFGAATALSFAQAHKTLGVVALDPWMFPFSASQRTRGLPSTPVLAISGRGFTVWARNAYKVKHMLLPRVTSGATAESDDVRKARSGDTVPYPRTASTDNVVVSLWQAEHQNFSDWCMLAPGWLLRRVGNVGPADPVRCLHAVCDFSRQFLIRHVVLDGASNSREQASRVKVMGFGKRHATTATPLLDASCASRPINADPSVLPDHCRVWGAPGVVAAHSASVDAAAMRRRARARSSSSHSAGDPAVAAAVAAVDDAGMTLSPAPAYAPGRTPSSSRGGASSGVSGDELSSSGARGVRRRSRANGSGTPPRLIATPP